MGKNISGSKGIRPKLCRAVGKNRRNTETVSGVEQKKPGASIPGTPLNCWEYKNCGCQPGGKNVSLLGVCPAAIDSRYHEINNGINGGRFCWLVEKTLCIGDVEHSFLDKFERCLQCDFYAIVHRQEKQRFQEMADQFLEDV
ncbi:MAG: hypothetical protein WCW40_05505 [Bacteroidota bacterium]|jgi:hypothetical protein